MAAYKSADAILFVYDQSKNRSLQNLADYWLKEVTKFCKPNCIKCVVANKSDYFLKTYNKYGLDIGRVDSEDEESSSTLKTRDLEEQMLAEIGKYVMDQDSKFLDEEDEEESEKQVAARLAK